MTANKKLENGVFLRFPAFYLRSQPLFYLQEFNGFVLFCSKLRQVLNWLPTEQQSHAIVAAMAFNGVFKLFDRFTCVFKLKDVPFIRFVLMLRIVGILMDFPDEFKNIAWQSCFFFYFSV